MEAMNQRLEGRILGGWNPRGLPGRNDLRRFPGILDRECVIRNGEWVQVWRDDNGRYIIVRDEKGDHRVLIVGERIYRVHPRD